ncbi:MAG: hypothetical protein AAFQ42_06730 [Pseudomonadota bacterium]
MSGQSMPEPQACAAALFDRGGIRVTPTYLTHPRGRIDVSAIRSLYFRREPAELEPGLMISIWVFAAIAIFFIIPIIEAVIEPKFLWVVGVGVFLACVSLQDFLTIRTPGRIIVFLRTVRGVRQLLSTSSVSTAHELRAALEAVGVRYCDAPAADTATEAGVAFSNRNMRNGVASSSTTVR